MYKEKNNLLPRKFSGWLTKYVKFDQMDKGKVRFLGSEPGNTTKETVFTCHIIA